MLLIHQGTAPTASGSEQSGKRLDEAGELVGSTGEVELTYQEVRGWRWCRLPNS
jgi:hypothetical protein